MISHRKYAQMLLFYGNISEANNYEMKLMSNYKFLMLRMYGLL